MKIRVFVALGSIVLLLLALPLFGQQPDKPVVAKKVEPEIKTQKLPLTKVVLFNAGIGYFQREGDVDGNARVELKVNEEDVNDLILTLVMRDPKGSSQSVNYDNKAPAEITLKAFSIDLTENAGMDGILKQVRGEKVEITDVSGSVVVGQVVSVEKPQARVATTNELEQVEGSGFFPRSVVIPPPADAIAQVSVLTEDGLQSLPLAKIKKVKFSKPELQQEFRKALEALASARGPASKSVGITFNGEGNRKVSVGYIADAPLWKPTYRVIQGKDDARLVGLAAIENTTDEDWNNVQVKLVSGRPMTFKMDLYDPLFVPRPLIEPELYASLRPPMYQAALTPGQGALGGAASNLGGGQFGFGGGQLGQLGGIQGGGLGFQGGMMTHAGSAYQSYGVSRPSVRSLLTPRLDYDSFSNRGMDGGEVNMPKPRNPAMISPKDSMNLGEAFEYAVKSPVSLPRFKSALLPVMDEPIDTLPVSIYNSQVLSQHPLKGMRITNKSKLFIAQGPVTVYEGDSIAGQARLPDVKPGETRLLSYAIDLDVFMKQNELDTVSTPVSLKILDGQIQETSRIRETRKYTAVNRSNTAKRVWITEVTRDDWKRILPAKAIEVTAQLTRYEVTLKPNETTTFEVVHERDSTSASKFLAEVESHLLKDYMNKAFASPAVKKALAQVLASSVAKANAAKGISDAEAILKEIGAEQTRIRANMKEAPKESDTFKRYLKKFDEQETEIEKRQAEIKKLKATMDKEQKDLVEFLRTLKVD